MCVYVCALCADGFCCGCVCVCAMCAFGRMPALVWLYDVLCRFSLTAIVSFLIHFRPYKRFMITGENRKTAFTVMLFFHFPIKSQTRHRIEQTITSASKSYAAVPRAHIHITFTSMCRHDVSRKRMKQVLHIRNARNEISCTLEKKTRARARERE